MFYCVILFIVNGISTAHFAPLAATLTLTILFITPQYIAQNIHVILFCFVKYGFIFLGRKLMSQTFHICFKLNEARTTGSNVAYFFACSLNGVTLVPPKHGYGRYIWCLQRTRLDDDILSFNTFRSGQNGQYSQMHFVKWNICVLIKIPSNCGSNKSALVQAMAWHWTGNKPLLQSMLSNLHATIWHHLIQLFVMRKTQIRYMQTFKIN